MAIILFAALSCFLKKVNVPLEMFFCVYHEKKFVGKTDFAVIAYHLGLKKKSKQTNKYFCGNVCKFVY